MLKYINSKKMERICDVRKRYRNCKVLMTDLDISDMADIKGYVYAVSTTPDSFKELCENIRS